MNNFNDHENSKVNFNEVPGSSGQEGFDMHEKRDRFLGGAQAPESREAEKKKLRLPTTMELRLRLLRMKKSERGKPLPEVPDTPTASDTAKYGRINWEHIKHKESKPTEGLAPYLHKMAKLMMTREGYRGINAKGEQTQNDSLWVSENGSTQDIGINEDWRIVDDGNHRALVLKLLGHKFVENSGMNDWVKITNYKKHTS